jgi:hypothetical protein
MSGSSEEVINPETSQMLFLSPLLSFGNDGVVNKNFLEKASLQQEIQDNENVLNRSGKNDDQDSMGSVLNTSVNETQKLILQRLKMLELEEALIIGLMKEMKIRDQLLLHSLSLSKPTSSENGKGDKKKERKKQSLKKDKDIEQQTLPTSTNFIPPFPVQSPFSSGSSTLSNQSFNSFNSAPLSLSPSSATKSIKPSSRHVMIDNIMYNADTDGCVYEDQPNHFPILPTPSYKHFKSSLITSDVPPPNQTSPGFDSNIMGGKLIEVEQLNSSNHYQCFNCGGMVNFYVIFIYFNFFFFFLIGF